MFDETPLETLHLLANEPEHPNSSFQQQLLDDLLASLSESAQISENPSSSEPQRVLDLVEPSNDKTAARRRWKVIALTAAAAIVIVIAAVGINRVDNAVVTDIPDSVPTSSTVAPTPTTEADVSTSTESTTVVRALPARPQRVTSRLTPPFLVDLLTSSGGADAIGFVGTIPERHRWHAVTFDPLDNSRVLFADVDVDWLNPEYLPTGPELWKLEGGQAVEAALPWYEEDDPLIGGGGLFQRDGGIVTRVNKDDFQTIPILNNDGSLRAEVVTTDGGSATAQFPSVLLEAEGARTATLANNWLECPNRAVNISSNEEILTVDRTDNGFARAQIVEPGVVVAFPYWPNSPTCEPLTETTTKAWDLESGELLVEHPLHGLEIARAAISGDGSTAITLSPNGDVDVLSLTTMKVVANLNRGAEAGHVLVPLALNDDGSLAAVAEQTGRVTLWHVDSGELLVELRSDTRSAPIEPLNGTPFGTQIAGALSYDASRVALLDESANTWTVLSLDPGDWVRGACLEGGAVSAELLSENGLDVDLACG